MELVVIIVLVSIFSVVSFLCYWFPKRAGHEVTGLITGISVFVMSSICTAALWEFPFLPAIVLSVVMMLCIVFLSYWVLRAYGRKTFGVVAAVGLALGFIWLVMSPWINDWTFGRNDAQKIFAEHGIIFDDNLKVLSSEAGGLMDYYHTIELRLSDSDYQKIKNEITASKDFEKMLSDTDYDYPAPNYPTRSDRTDTVNYESPFGFHREFFTVDKMSDGTYHFRFELSKSDNKLSYIRSNE